MPQEDPDTPLGQPPPSDNSRPHGGVWPPPPVGSPLHEFGGVQSSGSFEEIEKLKQKTKFCFWTSVLLCSFIHGFTLYYGLKANRLGAKGATTPYIVGGIIHLSLSAAAIAWRLTHLGMLSP